MYGEEAWDCESDMSGVRRRYCCHTRRRWHWSVIVLSAYVFGHASGSRRSRRACGALVGLFRSDATQRAHFGHLARVSHWVSSVTLILGMILALCALFGTGGGTSGSDGCIPLRVTVLLIVLFSSLASFIFVYFVRYYSPRRISEILKLTWDSRTEVADACTKVTNSTQSASFPSNRATFDEILTFAPDINLGWGIGNILVCAFASVALVIVVYRIVSVGSTPSTSSIPPSIGDDEEMQSETDNTSTKEQM